MKSEHISSYAYDLQARTASSLCALAKHFFSSNLTHNFNSSASRTGSSVTNTSFFLPFYCQLNSFMHNSEVCQCVKAKKGWQKRVGFSLSLSLFVKKF